MTTGQFIRNRRKELGLTVQQLADRCGVSKMTITRWENGSTDTIKQPMIVTLARALSVPPIRIVFPDETERNTDPSTSSNIYDIKRVAVFDEIGTIRAGYGGCIDEIPTGAQVQIPLDMLGRRDKSDYFVLAVHGQSMSPMFLEGDRILCYRTESVDPDAVAVVVLGQDEATLKKVHYEIGKPWVDLVPINKDYPTRRIQGSDLDYFRIYGKVVKLIRDI